MNGYRDVNAYARDIQPGDFIFTGSRDALVIERNFTRGGTVVEIRTDDALVKLSPTTRVYSFRKAV